MGGVIVKGGIPAVLRVAVAHGTDFQWKPPFITSALRIRTDTSINVFFNSTDHTAGANYMVVDPQGTNNNSPVLIPAEVNELWISTPTGGPANVEVVAFQRRG